MPIPTPTGLLKAALICASKEEARPYLQGVFLSTSGHMVTTDGHRMFVARLAFPSPADVIIPTYAISLALKLAGSKAEAIPFDMEAKRLGGVPFEPIDGTFPDWRRVVPTGEEMPSDNPELNDGPIEVHFNHAYVGDLAKMGKFLDGASVLHPRTASDPCLVTFGTRTDCFAILMPMRRKEANQACAVAVRAAVLG